MDDLGNAVAGSVEHVVRGGKAVGHKRRAAHFVLELVIENDDQAVDLLIELDNAFFGVSHSARALIEEGLGDNADRQDPHAAGDPGDDGGGSGAGAAAHACGDEKQIGSFKRLADCVRRLLRGRSADLGLGAGSKPGGSKRDQDVRVGLVENLLVRVGGNEGDSAALTGDHVLDGIAAAATDANDFDNGNEGFVLRAGVREHLNETVHEET